MLKDIREIALQPITAFYEG